jgi:hypothetical protein
VSLTIPRWQKPRLLPAADSIAALNSAEIAAPPIPRGQKPRLLPAADSIAALNSAEIAARRFQPMD